MLEKRLSSTIKIDKKHEDEFRVPHYEDFPPFPPPSGELAPGFAPPPTAEFPGSRKSSLIPGRPSVTVDPNAPKDRFNFVLITMFTVGLVNMLPMNFFITANEYWMYKFRTVGANSTNASIRNYLQANYATFNLVAITCTGIICNFFSTFLAHKIRLKTRAILSLSFFTTNFIVQTIFVKIDTDTWQYGFFGITLVIQVLMAILMAIAGTGTMTIASKFPQHYMKTFLIGQGVAGLMSALLRLMTITIFPETLDEALLYFSTGCVLMGAGFGMFLITTRIKFYKFYLRSSKEDAKKKINSVQEILNVAKMMWPILLLNFLLMVVPIHSLTNLVVSEYQGTGSTWGDKYFVTVMTYLLGAICDIIGRGLSTKFDDIFSIPILFIIVIVRNVTYGGMMMYTKAMPRTLPIYFGHDWQYGIILSTFQLSGGYLMNIIMLKTLKMVPKEKYELSLMIFMFCFGVNMGITSLMGLLMVSLLNR